MSSSDLGHANFFQKKGVVFYFVTTSRDTLYFLFSNNKCMPHVNLLLEAFEICFFSQSNHPFCVQHSLIFLIIFILVYCFSFSFFFYLGYLWASWTQVVLNVCILAHLFLHSFYLLFIFCHLFDLIVLFILIINWLNSNWFIDHSWIVYLLLFV